MQVQLMVEDQAFHFVLPRAPGDTVTLTAFLRDLRRQFSKIRISVNATGADQLLAGTPYVDTPVYPDAIEVRPDWRPGLTAARLNAQITYLEEPHRHFFRKFGVTVPLTEPRPDLQLTEEEQRLRPVSQRYWVVVAGHKWDMTVKGWSAKRFQAVVDQTKLFGLTWVQAGSLGNAQQPHVQFPLTGVISALGKTTLRQLMQLIYHADGVLCGSTMAMMIAAAFWKPCVVVAGGRESAYWLAFSKDNPAWGELASQIKVSHRFLHTIGQLDCCATTGCHCKQVLPPHNETPFPDGFLCHKPRFDGEQPLPACMQLVTAEQVVDNVLSYYGDGTLPPI